MRRAVAVVALLGFGMAAAPAGAGTQETSAGPLRYVTLEASIANNSSSSSFVLCPSPSRAVGAGGGISGGDPFRHVSQLSLQDGGDLGDTPDDGTLVNVSNATASLATITGVVVCLAPRRSQLSYPTTTGTFLAAESGSDPVIPAPCSVGTRIVGGGAGIEGTATQTALRDSFPAEAGTWTGAVVKGVTAEPRDYGTQGACLPSSLRKIKLRSNDAGVPSETNKTLRVSCPEGFHASGGGSDGGNNFEYFSSAPYDSNDAGPAPDDGWKVRVRNVANQSFDVEAKVVCLGPRKA